MTVLEVTVPGPGSPPAPPQLPLLTFTEPLLGFPRYRDYVLVPADASGLLYWLQSVTPDGPRFLALSAAAYFPGYRPALPGEVCAELGLDDVVDGRLYCLVTVSPGDVSASTANLRAPVVINPAAGRARQVVLADGTYPIRQPLRR